MNVETPRLKCEAHGWVDINLGANVKRVPTPQLLSNISMLYRFLHATVGDWKRVSAPYQGEIDLAPIDDVWASGRAFLELQPDFLRYLFSYCFFFVSAENAFRSLYNELKAASCEINLQVPSAPVVPDYIKKVRTVRNIAIAHFPSEKVAPVTSAAAMSWQPLNWNRKADERWSVDTITFGGFTHRFKDEYGNVIAESEDLEIRGIQELDRHCTMFLDSYDDTCCDLLMRLRTVAGTDSSTAPRDSARPDTKDSRE